MTNIYIIRIIQESDLITALKVALYKIARKLLKVNYTLNNFDIYTLI